MSLVLLPLNYFIFRKKGKVFSIVVASIISIVILVTYFFVVSFIMLFGNIGYLKEELHFSPDGEYVAIEYLTDNGTLGGNEWFTLYKNTPPYFVIEKSSLYSDGNYKEDLDVRWIDNDTIYIEGEYINIIK